MRDIKNVYGTWGLVAGSAEGLGEAYSVALASRGLNLIMADNQEEALNRQADLLEKKYGINTRRLHLDLEAGDSVEKMLHEIKETSCRLIVYNAAFSKVTRFVKNNHSDLDRYVDVNMRTPIQLVHAFTKVHENNIEHKKGIILMSSLAGLWGTKYLAPYGASKAFNRILAEALHTELKPLGFDVMTCIAGATATPAYIDTNPSYGMIRPSVMQSEKVAEGALSALGRRALYVPGFSNLMTYILMSRFLPRKTTVRIFNRTVGKMFQDA